MILADPPNSLRLDAVFPVCDENVYFSHQLAVDTGDVVLDLCTGSGIAALAAAEKARKVIAVDINPRAVLFARTSAAINGLEHEIRFCVGDLFGPVREKAFDTIIVNPPFEPVPADCRYYLHSNGGPTGMEVVNRVCGQVKRHLADNGLFQMILYSAFAPEETTWYNLLALSFGRVDVTLVKPVDGDEFAAELARRLAKLNRHFETTQLSVPEHMGLYFVTARNCM